MNHVLLYSRKSNPAVDLLVEELQSIGFTVDQTQSLNLPRIILNPYNTVHFLIEEFPLSIKEVLFMSLVKSLGKATILSVYNFNNKISKKTFNFLCPDVLSVSQTNHLKFFRAWDCNKVIIPQLPSIRNLSRRPRVDEECSSYLLPLESDLEEACAINTSQDIYFDARKLLTSRDSSSLRKNWARLLQNKKIAANYHLVLSEQKVEQLINEESVAVILANTKMSHTDFTQWLSLVVNRNNLVILNDYQATGFAQAWTSGRNCYVVSFYEWVKDVNQLLKSPPDLKIKTFFKSSQLVEPLINNLSRLYTKILHQKTSLLSSPSANIYK
ncbi:MAG: hypothetical protein H7328_11885 [Bdellovibrio sp.]|nr:hypothetical protein [Bdellovibrio sp.]